MNHAAQARQEPRPGIRNRIQLIASASRTGPTGRFKFIQRTFAGPHRSDADAPLADIDVTTISRPRATKPDINGSAYSITSSARARINGGIVRPSALAVLRLMMSLNVVGCSIGRSAG